uniref:Uncharacterized protein n=1 Tax=Oryza brachyantha TaxID=4533 RepID=J3N447_ORYBR
MNPREKRRKRREGERECQGRFSQSKGNDELSSACQRYREKRSQSKPSLHQSSLCFLGFQQTNKKKSSEIMKQLPQFSTTKQK